MGSFLKTIGFITIFATLCIGIYWVYKNFLEVFTWILIIIGALALLLGVVLLLLQFKKGNKSLFLLKSSLNIYFGSDLVEAIKKIIGDIENRDINNQNLAELAAHIIWRITRIGLFGVLIAIIPILILINQNQLLSGQNKLLQSQNQLVLSQNEKIEIQNNLIEADRRGALVVLMGNIMDQIDKEINIQKQDTLRKNPNVDLSNLFYSLSDPLIGRIAALSQGFTPYRYLRDNLLVDKEVSPERGQLLLALVKSRLDENTSIQIFLSSNFTKSYLQNADLTRANLTAANLRGSELSGANFFEANLSATEFLDANLKETIFKDAKLISTDFTNANLNGALFDGANLSNAILSEAILSRTRLSFNQLLSTRSLYGVENIPQKLREALTKEKPCLFKYPFSQDACQIN